jgi:16S rRNA (cytidine1402-2'-O)-methyltransferase
VATPLGNLGDLSPRAGEVLAGVGTVLAEDTRRAGLLFSRLGIKKPVFISNYEHNEDDRIRMVLGILEHEDVALISDAGTPLVSDPGFVLVRACREAGIPVVPIPGPCAPITALTASGFPPHPFVFLGFLPRKKTAVHQCVSPFAEIGATLIFFERKNRVWAVLDELFPLLGPRRFCLARELTKVHEEFIFGRLGEELEHVEDIRGELTVLIAPADTKPERPSNRQVREMIDLAAGTNAKPRELARSIAEKCPGWTVKEVYELLSGTR